MDLSFLSDVQRKAVTTVDGPVLVLAGAGSGKTSVLTNRVAYLIKEKQVDSYAILAITFTNKAAKEMKDRIAALLEFDTSRMMISTFHSMCAKFLRWDAEKIGYSNGFTIYDTDDSISVIKKVAQNAGLNPAQFSPRYLLHIISTVKNSSGRMPVQECLKDISEDFSDQLCQIYDAYIRRLANENAMDFDDLLINMLKLLNTDKQAREYYTNRFRYVLVDEYQDTNSIQYELVKIFSEKYKNLFVVGDDDQSIYGWRGADIQNILNFERDFPGATVIKLEQNYRSHQKILDAANAVIQGATDRKDKTLWSTVREGNRPKVYIAQNEYAEGEYIAKEITTLVKEDEKAYSDIAVLYRTHTQSRVLEEKLRAYGIPYKIFGDTSFYARSEIKYMIAYMTLLENKSSDTALLRVINTPRRGIGAVSIVKLTEFAAKEGISLYEAAERAGEFLPDGKPKFGAFLETMEKIQAATEGKSVGETAEAVFFHSGYRDMLLLEDDISTETKVENVEEFISSAFAYDKDAEEPTLEGFLSTVSLITDMDTVSEEGGVSLMTLHSSKGLEFDTVFIAGMEENLFPSRRSVAEGRIDEERRLCYVGITRAKKLLYMTGCVNRNLYSGSSINRPSQFLEDIPKELLENITGSLSGKIEARSSFVKEIQFKPQIGFANKIHTDPDIFRAGMTVKHTKFGKGKIQSIAGEGDQKVALVAFADTERKLFLSFAPLIVLD